VTYIFIYGTLKRGESNHSLLYNCEFVGLGTAKCFTLLDLGGCPGLIPGRADGSNDFTAHGEIYSVSDDKLPSLLRTLDHLEHNGSMYIRVKIPVMCVRTGRAIECVTYLFMPHFNQGQLVTGGNWSGEGNWWGQRG